MTKIEMEDRKGAREEKVDSKNLKGWVNMEKEKRSKMKKMHAPLCLWSIAAFSSFSVTIHMAGNIIPL